MDMIRHHDKSGQLEVIEATDIVLDGFDDASGNWRGLEPDWPGLGLIKCGVETGELPRFCGLRRQRAVKAKRDEEAVADHVQMGQPATIERHGNLLVDSGGESCHLFLVRAAGQGARPTPGPPSSESQRGVTLLEMLVVVGIVAILMGVSYPSIAASIDSVRLATAADSTAAFINSAINRAEQRHQVLELTIAKRPSQITLRSADPTFLRKLELPTGVRITDILPVSLAGEDEARVFYLIPGGAAPRVGVALVNARGAKRTVRVDPITGAPEIER